MLVILFFFNINIIYYVIYKHTFLYSAYVYAIYVNVCLLAGQSSLNS